MATKLLKPAARESTQGRDSKKLNMKVAELLRLQKELKQINKERDSVGHYNVDAPHIQRLCHAFEDLLGVLIEDC